MTANAKGDGPLIPEDSSATPDPAAKSDKSGSSSWEKFSNVMTVVIFLACWVFFGVVAFQALIGMGILVVFAVLGGIIGGFIAAVVVLMMAWHGQASPSRSLLQMAQYRSRMFHFPLIALDVRIDN